MTDRAARTLRTMRRLGRNLLLLLGGLLGGLLVAELALRAIYGAPSQVRSLRAWGFAPHPDPEIPYAHLPSCDWCLPETNSLGFLGPEPPAPRAGLLRVATVGDSVCAGYPLHYAQTLPARLEAELAARAPEGTEVRVASFCVGGFDHPENEAVIRKIVAKQGFDLVVLFPFVNDAAQIHFLTISQVEEGPGLYLLPRGERRGPFGWLPDETREALASVSYLFQEVQTRLALALLEHGGEDAAWRVLDEEQQRNLVGWQISTLQRAGTPVAVVPLPPSRHNRCLAEGVRLRPDADEKCREHEDSLDNLDMLYSRWRVPLLDLRTSLRAVPGRDLTLAGPHHDELHYSADGHAWLAGQIAPFVAGVLWPPSPEDGPPSPVGVAPPSRGGDAPPSPGEAPPSP